MSKTINDLNKSLTQVITPNAIGAATNSDLNTVKNNIGTVSNLQTTDKTIVGAINELFQSANNGKQLIANAIGEPLDSNDTFSAMSNDINGLLSTFKTNMMNNGITVEANDRFKSLIDKIATIVEEGSGKGIKIAAGKKSSSSGTRAFYKYANSGYVSLPYLEFSKSEFSFVPNVVVAFRNSTTSSSFYSIYAKINEHSFSCSVTSKNTGNSYAYLRLSDVTDIAYVPVYMNHTSYQYDYIAIGVGEEDTTLRDSLASILQEEGVTVTEEDDMVSLISKVDEEFNDIKQQLVNTLVSKGIDCSTTNSLDELYLKLSSVSIPYMNTGTTNTLITTSDMKIDDNYNLQVAARVITIPDFPLNFKGMSLTFNLIFTGWSAESAPLKITHKRNDVVISETDYSAVSSYANITGFNKIDLIGDYQPGDTLELFGKKYTVQSGTLYHTFQNIKITYDINRY